MGDNQVGTGVARPDALGKDFDAYVAAALSWWSAPGVVISVVWKGEHIFAKGYGTRKYGERLLPNSSTLFHIGSHAKSVTAAAVAMLVDEGRLSWDDPVKTHIPKFAFPDDYVTHTCTVRDLMTHRAGLPGLWDKLFVPKYDLSQCLVDLQEAGPVAGFREIHSYNNVNYALMGAIVARVSGMSWEDFVTERVFAPWG